MDLAATHQKLRFPRGPGRIEVYASLYRLGDLAGPRPVLVFIGGAATRANYLARIETEPVPIRMEVEKALGAVAIHTLDVLVCPGPQDTRLPGETRSAGLSWFEDHWDSELAPALGASPSAVGFVGYSAGAAYVMHMAVVLEAKAVAVTGGAGTAEAVLMPEVASLLHTLMDEGWSCDVGIFGNQGDQAPDPTSVARQLRPPFRPYPMPQQVGGHDFADYAVNGSVESAFRFVLERLTTG
jgi:hypothetical protein